MTKTCSKCKETKDLSEFTNYEYPLFYPCNSCFALAAYIEVFTNPSIHLKYPEYPPIRFKKFIKDQYNWEPTELQKILYE